MMSLCFKSMTVAATLLGLLMVSSARADFRDTNSKPWAQMHRRSVARSNMRYRRTYSTSAPAADAVAQAPSEERRFSYEPSEETAAGHCHCQSSADDAAAMANGSAETTRRYSYEPSTEQVVVPRRSYDWPSRRPHYLLQKTDPHKYNGS